MQEKVEQTVLGATAMLSVLVSLLDFLGLLGSWPWLDDRASALTLLVVGLTAGYLVLERRGKLDKIEFLLREGIERTIRSLDGVDVKRFPNYQELLEYAVKGWSGRKGE